MVPYGLKKMGKRGKQRIISLISLTDIGDWSNFNQDTPSQESISV